MPVSVLSTLLGSLSNNNGEELEDVGHFTALNLNYDSANYEAKKNAEQLIRELTIELQSYEEMFGEENNEGGNSIKSEIDMKRKLLAKIKLASRILTDDELKSIYLHEIKARCYLSQALTSNELRDKFSGRIFPFFTFEVYKKGGSLFNEAHHRFLCLNLVEMIIEEIKDDHPTRGFNCSSIKQIVPAFKEGEFYLTVVNGDESQTYHYQTKYAQQRELLIEMVLFSRYAAEQRTARRSEKMRNPNLPSKPSDKTPEELLNDAFGEKSSAFKGFKLLLNDRIIPPKPLFQCQVYKKRNYILNSEKKLWLTVGTSNILLSQDKEIQCLLHVFPINKGCISFIKTTDKGDFVINSNDTKHSYHTCKVDDADMLLNLTNDIMIGKVENEQVVSSFPYNKMDTNVTKILMKKLSNLDEKISETKKQLNTFRSQRREIINLLYKEKQKTRPNTMSSVESKSFALTDSRSMISGGETRSLTNFGSKTSISCEDNVPKAHVSLFTLDETNESIENLSPAKLFLSPIQSDNQTNKPGTMPNYFKKDSGETLGLNEFMNQSFSVTFREKSPSKSSRNSIKEENVEVKKKEERRISTIALIRGQEGGFYNRGSIKYMSAKVDKVEKVTPKRSVPMSMKEIIIEESKNTSEYPDLMAKVSSRKKDRPEFRKSVSINIDESKESKRQKV